ncbi:MAG: thymidine kinase [Lachnospiraceae bacterium]|nr:thymidine kinase [Lachnospiraceae bacterium]
MAKLVFHYGAMGSSKTANALMVAYNYEERNQKALILKPGLDTRDGDRIVRSRIGLSNTCELVETFIEAFKKDPTIIHGYHAIIVDEVQFATEEQIDVFSDIVDEYQIPVLCYGLRADFQNRFFPGSKRLMEIADEIKEIKTICWCGRKATCNARYDENGIVKEGAQVVLGANNNYISLCRRHFKEGRLR